MLGGLIGLSLYLFALRTWEARTPLDDWRPASGLQRHLEMRPHGL